MSRNRWVVVVATLWLATLGWNSLPGEEPKDTKEAKPAAKDTAIAIPFNMAGTSRPAT